MNKYILITTTFNNKKNLKKVTDILLERRLISCIQISKIKSKYFWENNINYIYLCGIETDACVMKTAVDLFENGLNVKVIEKYCMSHSGKKFHKSAIKMLKKLIDNKSVINY